MNTHHRDELLKMLDRAEEDNNKREPLLESSWGKYELGSPKPKGPLWFSRQTALDNEVADLCEERPRSIQDISTLCRIMRSQLEYLTKYEEYSRTESDHKKAWKFLLEENPELLPLQDYWRIYRDSREESSWSCRTQELVWKIQNGRSWNRYRAYVFFIQELGGSLWDLKHLLHIMCSSGSGKGLYSHTKFIGIDFEISKQPSYRYSPFFMIGDQKYRHPTLEEILHLSEDTPRFRKQLGDRDVVIWTSNVRQDYGDRQEMVCWRNGGFTDGKLCNYIEAKFNDELAHVLPIPADMRTEHVLKLPVWL